MIKLAPITEDIDAVLDTMDTQSLDDVTAEARRLVEVYRDGTPAQLDIQMFQLGSAYRSRSEADDTRGILIKLAAVCIVIASNEGRG